MYGSFVLRCLDRSLSVMAHLNKHNTGDAYISAKHNTVNFYFICKAPPTYIFILRGSFLYPR